MFVTCVIALYWQLEPSRTLALNPVIGTKKSKNRITILLCCNASGTEKLKPLLIHRYETPRSLNKIDKPFVKRMGNLIRGTQNIKLQPIQKEYPLDVCKSCYGVSRHICAEKLGLHIQCHYCRMVMPEIRLEMCLHCLVPCI